MPKRKRSGPESVHGKLEKHQDEIFRALKAAKGLERQRLSKRVHEDGIPANKKERLEREITVLKSLDLHQTARAHMHSSLLKVKSIAASTDLPDELRRGLSKPDLSEEEKTALHNVASNLYNRPLVRQAVDRAIADVCDALDVPRPEKAKRTRKGKGDEKGGQAKDGMDVDSQLKESNEVETKVEQGVDIDEEEEWQGFESDVDEPGPVVGELDSEAEADEEKAFSQYDHLLGSSSEAESDDQDLSMEDQDQDQDSEADADADEEKVFSKYDDLLGNSSEEGSDEDKDRYERVKGQEKVNLDDISSGSCPSEEEEMSQSDSALQPDPAREQPSLSPSPPPATKKKKRKKAAAKPTRPGDSTFLPTLMGGYISGSESEASDIDVAPAKKRLGQRQRQAIWEKKFGTKAKHLQQQAAKGKRDSGWDMKRGAVEGAEGGARTPWKKGIQNPLLGKPGRSADGETGPEKKPKVRVPGKKDDEGPLHPSWEAMKKAKEQQKTAAFAGSKIVFD